MSVTSSPAAAAAPAQSGDSDGDRLSHASQRQLVWLKFRRHKLALVSLAVLAALYVLAIFADFFGPYPKNYRIPDAQFSSPTRIRVFDPATGFTGPFVYAARKEFDEATYTYRTVPDRSRRITIRFFIRGAPYKILGLIPSQTRLFGVTEGYVALFGTNNIGMDVYSQSLYAGRISLSVGLIGVLISFLLGVTLGGISGYFGGFVDDAIQRLIEFILSLPQLPLWIALSAAIPNNWSGIETFFAITIILSFIGWTGLARVVRGRLISMREEDYVMAAKVAGSTDRKVIVSHLLPGFLSYLVVSITLAIPHMILGETTLSFLGLGILPPEVSWGSMMQQARSLIVIFNYPWHLIPTIFIVTAVLAFNFIGDGLRDAADPYSR